MRDDPASIAVKFFGENPFPTKINRCSKLSARQYIAPENGIQKNSFFEDISSRGLEQMLEFFEKLYLRAATQLPKGHAELGDLALIDGSLINAVLSMYWADYRDRAKKAKVHRAGRAKLDSDISGKAAL